jgi:hypothetical protein
MSYLTKDLLDQNLQLVIFRKDNPTRVQEGFWGGGSSYPMTVRGKRRPGGSQIPRFEISRDWAKYIRDVNPFAVRQAFFEANGYFNKDWTIKNFDPWNIENSPKIKAEHVSWGLNIAVAKEIIYKASGEIKHVLIDSIDHKESPPDPNKVNYKTAALYIHKFTSISNKGVIGNLSPPGMDTCDYYTPLLSTQDFWVDMEDDYTKGNTGRIELLPKLPMKVYPIWWKGVTVRKGPSTKHEKVDAIPYKNSFWIDAYYPTDTGIWARIKGENTFIALRYQWMPGTQWNYNLTNWNIDTEPPYRPYNKIPGNLINISGTYGDKTHQDIINIFYISASSIGEFGWNWIEQANLEYLVKNRSKIYQGPRFKDIHTLNKYQIKKLQEVL